MSHDLAIIGAGPAGMTAASVAAENGLNVLLLDDQPAAGGQIYRGIENAAADLKTILGDDYAKGLEITRRFHVSGAQYQPSTVVWQVTDDLEIACSAQGRSQLIRPSNLILATGAMERPFPIPGWTLPGVMMAGAAQTLLKSSSLAADGAVFAGCGPLLYLVVAQYLRAGLRVAAVLDTTEASPLRRAARHLPAALSRADLLIKGRRWIKEIHACRVPIINNVTDLKIIGAESTEGVSFQVAAGDWQDIPTTHVFLHQGVVPNVNLSMSIGLARSWNAQQLCWQPDTDKWGASSIGGIFVAGDGAGIRGALSAAATGEIAALQALSRQGRITQSDRDQRAQQPLSTLRRENMVRPFLDSYFRPAAQFRVPRLPDTIVCRCEEITRAEITETISVGIAGPNQLKSFTRAGMGPCQGRFCGLTVQELIATETGRPPAEVGYYRLRPPIKPIRLEEIANLQPGEQKNEIQQQRSKETT